MILPMLPYWIERFAVTLLGDAARAMTPNLGQGGCRAIEDAVVRAKAIHNGETQVPVALQNLISLS
jgi:2-polyprenyl-6-methoxyphenol hydroxylase-like FAD-dependent oxidoreductase